MLFHLVFEPQDRPAPQLLDGVGGSAQRPPDLVERPPFQVAHLDDLAIVFGKAGQALPELLCFFVCDGSLARCGPIERRLDFAPIGGKRGFAVELTFLGVAKLPRHIAEIVEQVPAPTRPSSSSGLEPRKSGNARCASKNVCRTRSDSPYLGLRSAPSLRSETR